MTHTFQNPHPTVLEISLCPVQCPYFFHRFRGVGKNVLILGLEDWLLLDYLPAGRQVGAWGSEFVLSLLFFLRHEWQWP
jgi:hypothetical protein